MIRKFFAALGCAVLGAAVMLLALPLLPKQLLPHGRAETLAGGGDRARRACGRAVRRGRDAARACGRGRA